MQRHNFDNVNGEDIELASRDLSQAQISSRGRTEVDHMHFDSPCRLSKLIAAIGYLESCGKIQVGFIWNNPNTRVWLDISQTMDV